MNQALNHGSIWLANLNPRRGTETGRTRPVLIVQCSALIDAQHPSTIIIPLTTNLIDDAAPLRIRVPAKDKLKKDSDLLVDQIRAVDNRRLASGPLLQCGEEFMEKVYAAIIEVMGIKLSV